MGHSSSARTWLSWRESRTSSLPSGLSCSQWSSSARESCHARASAALLASHLERAHLGQQQSLSSSQPQRPALCCQCSSSVCFSYVLFNISHQSISWMMHSKCTQNDRNSACHYLSGIWYVLQSDGRCGLQGVKSLWKSLSCDKILGFLISYNLLILRLW